MSRICEVCGKKPVAGRTYARRGLAKSKGGVGRKITGITKRRFRPNIQVVRIVDEKGAVRRSRICVKCLRTGLRKGTITKAVRKSRAPKEVAEPTSAAPAEAAETGEAAEIIGTAEGTETAETVEAVEDRKPEMDVPAEATGDEGFAEGGLDDLDTLDNGPQDE